MWFNFQNLRDYILEIDSELELLFCKNGTGWIQ